MPNWWADKFYVLRLLNPAIDVRRSETTGDKRSNPVRKSNGHQLNYFERRALHQWLDRHPMKKDVYISKEAAHRFYRIKAARALIRLTDQLALSKLKEIKPYDEPLECGHLIGVEVLRV